MRRLTLVAFMLVFASPLFAQGTNLQFKTVVRPTVAINDNWFVASWNVTNVRENATDNTNFMLGIGRQQKNWWLEVMLQRQDDTKKAHHWFVDVRSSFTLTKEVGLYVEVAPFLDTKAVYNFIRLDVAILSWLKLGIESENLWGIKTPANPDSKPMLGIGPCVGLGPVKLGPLKPSVVVSWQFRRNDSNFLRTYVVLPLKF